MSFPVEDWEAIPIDTYKNLLLEIKEQLQMVNEEIVSVTEKSIKCLLGFFSYVLGAGIFLITNHYEINWYCYLILLLISGYNGFKGYTIIKSRKSHSSGLSPENVLSKDFNLDTGFSDEEKEKLFYYKAVISYKTKVTDGAADNEERAKKYDTFFGLTLLLVFLITLFIFFTISYHPVFVKF